VRRMRWRTLVGTLVVLSWVLGIGMDVLNFVLDLMF
jgi:hypothetical protein